MKELTVPIDKAGRIVLPKEIRLELGIQPGDTLTAAVQGSSISLTPQKRTPAGFIRKGKALIISIGGDYVLRTDEVNRLIESMREERERSILGLPADKIDTK